MKTFYIETLGCKVNQYESDGIASCLEENGMVKGGRNEPADVCIINTCAVTSKAGMQSRQAIRKIIRNNPDARIIVTGCHAQTDPDQIKKIERIDQIVCHRDKAGIAERILNGNGPAPDFKPADHSSENRFQSFGITVKGSMTRAYLKIQDGCNAFCTYCIVPYARGSSVSMPEKEVFRHLDQLESSGFKEVILTGIHTGMYGRDFIPRACLADLIEKINTRKPVHRIRVSSIEPGEIDDRIISLADPGKILCDHFHIPLQSGDDEILRKMKRPYSAGFFTDMVHKIHHRLPLAGIGIDVLVGFPSETDQQFENTFRLIQSLPVSYLHVFPFSARKGTPAYHFDQKVDPDVIKERCRRMRELGAQKKMDFIRSNMGKRLDGLVQHREDEKTGLLKVVTSNYLTLYLDPALSGSGYKSDIRSLKGKIVDIVPEGWDSNQNLVGKLINPVEDSVHDRCI